MKSFCQKNVNKMKTQNGQFHAHVCVCLRGGREAISNWNFLVVVPQPPGFCILKKWANGSAWFTFLWLIPHFLPRHFLAKCSFHSSVCLLWTCRNGCLTKMGPLAFSRKIQKLIQRGILDKYPCIVKSSLRIHRNTVM